MQPDVLGIVDTLDQGDDLDVEAILERDHYDPGDDDYYPAWFSDPDR